MGEGGRNPPRPTPNFGGSLPAPARPGPPHRRRADPRPPPRPPSARREAAGAGPSGRGPREPPLTLGDGDGLEAVQLPQQAAPLGGVQAVDEVAGPLRRVQRLHRLLLGVGAQRPPGRRRRLRRPQREEQPLGAASQAAQAATAAAARGATQRAQAGGGGGGSGDGAPQPPQQQRRPAEPRRHGAGQGRGARAARNARRRSPRAAAPRGSFTGPGNPHTSHRPAAAPASSSSSGGGGAPPRTPLRAPPLRPPQPLPPMVAPRRRRGGAERGGAEGGRQRRLRAGAALGRWRVAGAGPASLASLALGGRTGARHRLRAGADGPRP